MGCLAILGSLIAAALSGVLLVRSHYQSIHQQLQVTASTLLTLGISHFDELNEFEKVNSFIKESLKIETIDKIIRIYDQNGKIIFTSVGIKNDFFSKTLTITPSQPIFATIYGEKRNYRSLLIPYKGKIKRTFYLQILMPFPQFHNIVQSVMWPGSLLFLLLFLISLLFSRLLSARLLKPVKRLASHLRSCNPDYIEDWESLPEEQEEYLSEITKGVNRLHNKISNTIGKLRKMGHFAAHELRTPLTIIQGETETLLLKKSVSEEEYRSTLKSILEEVRNLSQIITTILNIADTKEKKAAVCIESLEFLSWFQKHEAEWEFFLERTLITFFPKHEVRIDTDKQLLYHCIDNIFRNIKKHTPANTKCFISLQEEKDYVVIDIWDNGPGITEEVLTQINKKKAAKTSQHLGIELCYRIADLCQFQLTLYNKKNEGLAAKLFFKK